MSDGAPPPHTPSLLLGGASSKRPVPPVADDQRGKSARGEASSSGHSMLEEALSLHAGRPKVSPFFASPATALLPRYWTPGPIEGSAGVDAFAQRWEGERLWVHPPPSLLLTVVQMLETHTCEAFVCAPQWPGAAWYGLLLSLSSEYLHLPPGSLTAVAGDAPPLVQAWPLTVFRVRGGRRTR